MDWVTVAAVVFSALTICVVMFQLALAAGAPWGEYAMGGATPGRLSAPLRVAVAVQAALLTLLAGVVLSRAGVALAAWSGVAGWAVWVVVAVSALALVLNTITRSTKERRIWAPVTAVMLASSLAVAVLGG